MWQRVNHQNYILVWTKERVKWIKHERNVGYMKG